MPNLSLQQPTSALLPRTLDVPMSSRCLECFPTRRGFVFKRAFANLVSASLRQGLRVPTSVTSTREWLLPPPVMLLIALLWHSFAPTNALTTTLIPAPLFKCLQQWWEGGRPGTPRPGLHAPCHDSSHPPPKQRLHPHRAQVCAGSA